MVRHKGANSLVSVCCSTPNMLNKRVLSSPGEFRSGPKRATRETMERRGGDGGIYPIAVAAAAQFEV